MSSSYRRIHEIKEIGQDLDSKRISQEVEEVIKRIEDKKKIRKTGKLMEKKRKRGDNQALPDEMERAKYFTEQFEVDYVKINKLHKTIEKIKKENFKLKNENLMLKKSLKISLTKTIENSDKIIIL